MTKAFRPQHFNGKFKLREGFVGKWHYRLRTRWEEDNHILRVFGQLHYLGSHAPKPINKKWRRVEKKFYERYKKYL